MTNFLIVTIITQTTRVMKRNVAGFIAISGVAALVLTGASSRAQSLAYSNAIVSLNPVGYWPMHETNAPAPGDVETNLGTLGALANGYYNDWSPANLSGAAHIYREFPGPFTNNITTPDYGIEFSNSGPRLASSPYMLIPNVSPLMQLKPPFTIEWWANANVHQGGNFSTMVSQGGGAGFNNSPNYGGFSANWNSTAVNASGAIMNMYAYGGSGSGTSGGASGAPSTLVATNQWYYYAYEFTANNTTLAVANGNANAGGQLSPPLNPAPWSPFWVGNGRSGNTGPAGFSFDGAIAELAIYTNALSTADLYNHYVAGTNANPTTAYTNLVLNDPSGPPVVYLRMDAPGYTAPPAASWPPLDNFGTTAGDGVYTPGTVPGILSESVTNGYPVYLATNQVALLSAMGTFADIGSSVSAACNPTGSNANFTVLAMFRGNPADPRIQSIVGHGTNSWQLGLTTSGTITFNAGNGNGKAAGATGSAAGDLTTSGVYNDGYWHQVAVVNTTNVISIYVDGALDTNGTPSGVTATNIIPGNASDAMIGADPSYTNANVGLGRQFSGQICEVSFINTNLSANQIATLYNTAGGYPYIKTQPPASVIANGGSGTSTNLIAVARGSSLMYQWYYNSSSNYNGATALQNNSSYGNVTGSALTITNLASGDNGYYYLVASDTFGSVTSSLANVFVFGSPVVTTYAPVTYSNVFSATVTTNFLTVYAGVSPAFSVIAGGAQPLSYEWFTNGVLDGAVTGTNLALDGVQGSFTNECVVGNSLGDVTNIWVGTVLPTNALASYPLSVLALNPAAYWTMNDATLDGADDGNGDDGYVCHDYVNGNDGIYTNVDLANGDSLSSYNPIADPSDVGANFGYVASPNSDANSILAPDFSTPTGSSAEFSIEAWVNPVQQEQTTAGIVAKGLFNEEEFVLDCGAPTNSFRFEVRNAAGTVYNANSLVSTANPNVQNTWYHLVGVCDEANGLVSLYIDGQLVASTAIPVASGITNSSETPITIGSRSSSAPPYEFGNNDQQFAGYVDEVAAFDYALSPTQVVNQYCSAGDVGPFFVSVPTNASASANQTLTIPVTAWGSAALSYEWFDVNGQPIPGAAGTSSSNSIDATLTVSSVSGAWNNGAVRLMVNNGYGSTNIYVSLAIATNPPTITVNLPAHVTIAANQSYTFAPTITGAAPFTYQWYNGALPGESPIFGQTNATYTINLGTAGTYTYSVSAANFEGSTNSIVSTVTVVAAPTNAYAAAILALNPVAYWPMHEMEPPAAGDIETNYGTLGLLGTGYYSDWVWPQQGLIDHDFGGALAGDDDAAVYFNWLGGQNNGGASNTLQIPITSPRAVLNPPFTVECWFYPTNSNGAGDLWGQSGFVQFNDGNEGSGNGNVSGIRLYWNSGNTFQLYCYNGADGDTLNPGGGSISVSPFSSFGQWHYVVLTCDSNTNMTLYVDATNVGSSGFAGSYAPDSWTPITVATGRGYTRSLAEGVDEFAVYNYALSGTVITNHYTNGLSSAAGAYFQAVTNSAPAIYLRMDSPPYLPPAAGTWPTLLNFGSVAAEGLYNPGTMPGIVPGPALNGLSSNTNVPQLSGVSSFADAGFAPAYNPVGSNAFSVTAMFRGDPCDGRYQDIVGHSDSSWRIAMNNNGHLQCQMGTNGALDSVGSYNDGNWHQVVDVYQPASSAGVDGTNTLYVDGMLDTSISSVTPNGILPGSSADVLIGAAPDYTNNPASLGRQFAGQVCEVALFTNALTLAQVQALYNSAEGVSSTGFTNAPPIAVSTSGGELSLTWPAKYVGYYYLEVQTNNLSVGISTNWVPYGGSVAATLNSGGVTNSINAGNGCVFYRLMTNAP